MSTSQELDLSKKIALLEAALEKREAELLHKDRALEVERALEMVRIRTMEMRNSSELSDTSAVLYQELKELKIHAIRTSVGIFDDPHGAIELWTTFSDQQEEIKILDYVNLHIHPVLENTIAARKQQKSYVLTVLSGKQVKEYYTTMSTYLSQEQQVYNDKEYFYSFFFPGGMLNVVAFQELAKEECDIMIRFARVFGLIYTRFLDLKKAEAQARESEIQLALERVRARTMAMKHSHELADASFLLDSQVRSLGIETRGCAFNIYGDNDSTEWFSSKEGTLPAYKTPRKKIFLTYYNAGQQGESMYIKAFGETDCAAHYDYLCTIPVMGEALLEFKKAGGSFPKKQIDHVTYFKYGYLLFITLEPVPEAHDIFKRFAKEFEQTYTRFLDLKKAEAQARDAEIELALERVRALTMAMHNSEDVGKCIINMFGELTALGVDESTRFGIGILNQDNENNQLWTAKKYGQEVKMHIGNLDMTAHPLLKSARNAWKAQVSLHTYVLEGEDLVQYYQMLNHAPDYKIQIAIDQLPEREIHYGFIFDQGFFYAFTPHEFEPGIIHIIQRFSSLFGQTYRRYLDLVKAEEQAREAEIEAALERVRSSAMAMHTSEEVEQAIHTLFVELEKLNLKMIRCGIIIISDEKYMQAWTTSLTEGGEAINISGKIDMTIHPTLISLFETWSDGKDYFFYTMEGDESQSYYEALAKSDNYKLPRIDEIRKKHYSQVYLFEEGGLYAFTQDPITDHDAKIYRRFANVFTLTYRRYQDLQKAEQRAELAVREASLDRVRGEIASMRTAEDLKRITPLLWRELSTLGVPFFRCGLMIVKEADDHVQFYLSTPDGKPLAALDLPINDFEITRNGVAHWRSQKVFIEHWDQQQFMAFTKSMMELKQIREPETYQGGAAPPASLTMQFVPFPQGMLYVGSAEKLSSSQIELVQALAETFSTAYARYEDFTNLDSAKKQIEKTLTDLQTTQKQLIQSEKMASLGELTAGIAHEIQNPLNFVNNFSELNKELITEMEEAIQRGAFEEAKDLAKDIFNNQEKINHHGKRAEGIVKGMLQHSRSGGGQRELTDINVLCDEYLRLSFHGLRAKDKSFNAKFETEFDPSLPKVNIVPQDIGRVILNLINNAFYAVNQPRTTSNEQRNPLVKVTTKTFGDQIEINIQDNGPGIPEHIKEKIFQPFFTTKPTGQGTGLGLSLSYDIVKAHGGELQVHSSIGQGTEFLLQLPLS